MRTSCYNSKNAMQTFALALCLLAAAACTRDRITMPTGGKSIEAHEPGWAASLRSGKSTTDRIEVQLNTPADRISDEIFASLVDPSALEQTFVVKVDTARLRTFQAETNTEYTLLPAPFYVLDGGPVFRMPAGDLWSEPRTLRIFRTNPFGNVLAPGRYLLPLTLETSSVGVAAGTLCYSVTVLDKQTGDHELFTEDGIVLVEYVNTSQYDPRLAADYYVQKIDPEQELVWHKAVGNIVNLRPSQLTYEPASGRVLLRFHPDLQHVLDHYDKYIPPIRDPGRKVCLNIDGGSSGVSFCNLSDSQIADFADQVRLFLATYDLDGISLWDRNPGYGKEGTPPMDSTSYPKLVKSLREAIGPDKLLTLTDYEASTGYFWDTDATGGIEVGAYLDYAWSGYCDHHEGFQVVDPYHPDGTGVSTLHPRKPIAGLPPERYGCINFPWKPGLKNESATNWDNSEKNVMAWVEAGNKQNNVCVLEDIRTHLQDNYEFSWRMSFPFEFLFTDSHRYAKQGYGPSYVFGSELVGHTETGYGKWLKDW